jgi:serine/threonine protein kinase
MLAEQLLLLLLLLLLLQVSKLYAEVSVMRDMDHPHIVRLREVFYSKRYIYLIMDMCSGGELFNLVTGTALDCILMYYCSLPSCAPIGTLVQRLAGLCYAVEV